MSVFCAGHYSNPGITLTMCSNWLGNWGRTDDLTRFLCITPMGFNIKINKKRDLKNDVFFGFFGQSLVPSVHLQTVGAVASGLRNLRI